MFTFANHCLALTAEEATLVDSVIASKVHPVPWEDIRAIKAIGPDAVDPIAEAYAAGDLRQKERLAWLLWRLRLENEKATQVLLKDAKTRHTDLRLNVQYALGSVSGDKVVVDTLLDTMRNDKNGLFRDKAACSMANDLWHLDYQQRYYLFRGLIDGLGDELYQIRNISIKALHAHTGQKMGYTPKGGAESRIEAIARWNEWLKEYQQSL
jgi:hypothetical protein